MNVHRLKKIVDEVGDDCQISVTRQSIIFYNDAYCVRVYHVAEEIWCMDYLSGNDFIYDAVRAQWSDL